MQNPILSTKTAFCGIQIGIIDRRNYLFDDVHPYRFRPTSDILVSIYPRRIFMEQNQ